MNRYFNYLITGAAAVTLFAACNGMDGELDGGGTAVLFTAGNIAAVQTRTAIGTSGETEWALNDPAGIFMTGAASVDNRKYTVSNVASGALAPDGAGNTLVFPQSGSVDFIAYYPWKNGQTLGNYPVDVSNQSNPATIDLLYSNNATGKDNSSNPVNLEFKHVLAKLKMTVTAGTGFSNLSGLTAVEIQNTGTTAGLKLSNGTDFSLTATGNIAARQASPVIYEAILIPGYYASGKVKFTVDGNDYFWDIGNPNFTFAPGMLYNYTVTVNKTGITVSPVSITDWTVTAGGNLGEAAQIPIPVVLIPHGTFMMGSPTDETGRYPDETQHEVTLTKDFYMSRYQVTNAQYAAFLNANNIGNNGLWASGSYPAQRLVSASSSSYNWGLNWDGGNSKWVPASGYDNHPVIYVTWYGASEYARWAGGSLPTEAQWEYACRAGTTTAFSYGTSENGDYMWYSSGSTHEVGQKLPNAYDLYDMHGNVYEWCEDSWNSSAAYGPGAVTDPVSPNPGSFRVLRGGSWDGGARGCRSAFRGSDSPVSARNYFGFRVVFVL
ncbi:hypothetical protein FACS1894181_14050 [Bacteroidia bacterium]|nr:hypothetical protein FACS1894181_14050 [Bacteroidia bacterium]